MKQYFLKLIPRLKQFSETLDRKEIFVEQPWVIIDKELNKQKYIFQRNGVLIMSLNGQATLGHWEYIATAKSLLIDRVHDKLLLNQAFIDQTVMILRKDGFTEENFILANELLLPDLNVDNYIKKVFYAKNNISTIQLADGRYLELSAPVNSTQKPLATIEGEEIRNGIYELEGSGKKYVIEEGRLNRVLVKHKMDSNVGEIEIEYREFGMYVNGDNVYLNGVPAPDGKYRLGFMNTITVSSGKIIDLT